MYINSAYLNNSLIDFKDKSRPLIVGSCGTYHLYTHPRLPTHRPSCYISHLAKRIFILTTVTRTQWFMQARWFSIVQKNHKDMSIMAKNRQKCIGFILLVIM